VTKHEDLILWPQPDGTSRIIGADDIRALIGYVEQRDGIDIEHEARPHWSVRGAERTAVIFGEARDV